MTTPSGEQGGQWPNDTFWLRAGWLIDGLGKPAVRDRFIEVCDGIICQVTPRIAEGDPADLIDVANATVMPLLMDAHVHLGLSGTCDAGQRRRQLFFAPGQVDGIIKDHLSSHWRHGVSAVREAGDGRGSVWHHLRGNSTPSRPPVSVALTRWAWHAPGRYGAMIGRTPDPGMALCHAAADYFPDIDHVKVIQSGINSIDRFGHQGPPQFSKSALSALVRLAHQHQVKVMVHANGEAPVASAIDARCDSIEHGYFMGCRNLQRMADSGITWVPTIIPMVALSRSKQLTARQRDTAQRTVEHQLEQIHQARVFGVRIGLGTDAGSPGVDHGLGVYEELALLSSAGLSAEQAISCATAHNAQLLGQRCSGALVPGMQANLLIIHHGPDRIIGNLRQITAVCYQGQWQSKRL